MNELSGLILGIVQGFTEFLPVSSSGHLVIVERILDFESPGVLFETFLHLGTTLAVIWVFRDRIFKLKFRDAKLIVIASMPAAIVGIFFRGQIESLFSSTKLVGIALLITAAINYLTDRQNGRKENVDKLDGFFIGIAQAFALIPGISRSGSTIMAARSVKISGKSAAEFSFLLSIPAVLGANLLEIYTHGFGVQASVITYLLGFLASLASGLIAIKLVLRFLEEKKFRMFSLYCVAMGLISLLLL